MSILRFCVVVVTLFFNILTLLSKEIYVSTKGNDLFPGTKDQPVASLFGARDLIRQLRNAGSANEEYRVIIADGTYFMNEPLILTELDSGSEAYPLTFYCRSGSKSGIFRRNKN